MASPLSNSVENLAKGIHNIKCKDCDCFLEHRSVKGNSIYINVHLAIKIIHTSLMKNLKKQFKNIFKFSNNDINKFLLLIRKGVYPYE